MINNNDINNNNNNINLIKEKSVDVYDSVCISLNIQPSNSLFNPKSKSILTYNKNKAKLYDLTKNRNVIGEYDFDHIISVKDDEYITFLSSKIIKDINNNSNKGDVNSNNHNTMLLINPSYFSKFLLYLSNELTNVEMRLKVQLMCMNDYDTLEDIITGASPLTLVEKSDNIYVPSCSNHTINNASNMNDLLKLSTRVHTSNMIVRFTIQMKGQKRVILDIISLYMHHANDIHNLKQYLNSKLSNILFRFNPLTKFLHFATSIGHSLFVSCNVSDNSKDIQQTSSILDLGEQLTFLQSANNNNEHLFGNELNDKLNRHQFCVDTFWKEIEILCSSSKDSSMRYSIDESQEIEEQIVSNYQQRLQMNLMLIQSSTTNKALKLVRSRLKELDANFEQLKMKCVNSRQLRNRIVSRLVSETYQFDLFSRMKIFENEVVRFRLHSSSCDSIESVDSDNENVRSSSTSASIAVLNPNRYRARSRLSVEESLELPNMSLPRGISLEDIRKVTSKQQQQEGKEKTKTGIHHRKKSKENENGMPKKDDSENKDLNQKIEEPYFRKKNVIHYRSMSTQFPSSFSRENDLIDTNSSNVKIHQKKRPRHSLMHSKSLGGSFDDSSEYVNDMFEEYSANYHVADKQLLELRRLLSGLNRSPSNISETAEIIADFDVPSHFSNEELYNEYQSKHIPVSVNELLKLKSKLTTINENNAYRSSITESRRLSKETSTRRSVIARRVSASKFSELARRLSSEINASTAQRLKRSSSINDSSNELFGINEQLHENAEDTISNLEWNKNSFSKKKSWSFSNMNTVVKLDPVAIAKNDKNDYKIDDNVDSDNADVTNTLEKVVQDKNAVNNISDEYPNEMDETEIFLKKLREQEKERELKRKQRRERMANKFAMSLNEVKRDRSSSSIIDRASNSRSSLNSNKKEASYSSLTAKRDRSSSSIIDRASNSRSSLTSNKKEASYSSLTAKRDRSSSSIIDRASNSRSSLTSNKKEASYSSLTAKRDRSSSTNLEEQDSSSTSIIDRLNIGRERRNATVRHTTIDEQKMVEDEKRILEKRAARRARIKAAFKAGIDNLK